MTLQQRIKGVGVELLFSSFDFFVWEASMIQWWSRVYRPDLRRSLVLVKRRLVSFTRFLSVFCISSSKTKGRNRSSLFRDLLRRWSDFTSNIERVPQDSSPEPGPGPGLGPGPGPGLGPGALTDSVQGSGGEDPEVQMFHVHVVKPLDHVWLF